MKKIDISTPPDSDSEDSLQTLQHSPSNSTLSSTSSYPSTDDGLRKKRNYQSHSYMKWLILCLSCLLVFGNYYCYDIPGALNLQIGSYLNHDSDIWQFEMNALYAVYSFPNLILPLMGGYLMDKWGSKKLIILLSLFVLVGHSLFSFSLHLKHYPLMLMGRFLFGIGGESLEVLQSTLITNWFYQTDWLSIALGLSVGFIRVAGALNDWLSPWIGQQFSVSAACLLGVGVCFISFLSGLILCCLSKQDSDLEDDEELLLNDDDDDDSTIIEKQKLDEMNIFQSLLSLPKSFWVLCLLIMLLYGSVNPLIHILTEILQTKWFPNEAEMAGRLMSLPDILSAFLSPLCGLLIDYYCRRNNKSVSSVIWLLPLSSLLLSLVHFLLFFTFETPLIALSLLGISYSIFGTLLWPLVPHMVDQKQLGLAYGLSTVCLNAVLTLCPLLVGKLISAGMFSVGWWFLGWSLSSLLCGLYLMHSK